MAKQLQLKITLKGTKPPIWRRVLITDNITFETLHRIIQSSMGWYNCHLYEFSLGFNTSIGIQYEGFYEDILDARKIKVSKYLNEKGDKIVYSYDFGDNWEHVLTVEDVGPVISSQEYPSCIKGKGNCPPEDCGGVWGFYELLEKINNPKDPEHKEMLEWLGEGYDPTEFKIEEVNRRLKGR